MNVAKQVVERWWRVKAMKDAIRYGNRLIMMGHRGVRLGVTYPEITETQVRAIFEATAELLAKKVKVSPEIMLCDKHGEKSKILSDRLLDETDRAVMAGKNALFIINRTGYASACVCLNCLRPYLCKKCGGPVALHKGKQEGYFCLRCGTEAIKPFVCPHCKNSIFRQSGGGTQKAVSELDKFFPDAGIIRFDAETVKNKSGEGRTVTSAFTEGMRLEADPTVQYALGFDAGQNSWWRKGLTYADLKFPSPYNTYYKDGLPPGPIANPGLASISAALNPAATDALFFVADGTGRHQFTQTFNQHGGYRSVRKPESCGGYTYIADQDKQRCKHYHEYVYHYAFTVLFAGLYRF